MLVEKVYALYSSPYRCMPFFLFAPSSFFARLFCCQQSGAQKLEVPVQWYAVVIVHCPCFCFSFFSLPCNVFFDLEIPCILCITEHLQSSWSKFVYVTRFDCTKIEHMSFDCMLFFCRAKKIDLIWLYKYNGSRLVSM